MQSSDTIKYIIHAKIKADGVIERPDVIGAIFGQTEGLIGNDLDLRELQKSGRIGRLEVNIKSNMGKSQGSIEIPSSLDRVETAVLAASLETIDRIGPCLSHIDVVNIEDVRTSKRKQIVDRAKIILTEMFDAGLPESQEITAEIRQSIRIEDMTTYGKDNIPMGPNVLDSDAILVVEGRADVLNLLKYGIKNAIAVGGTNVPVAIVDICKKKICTAFTDGDRGGELIIKELLQVADIDYIARAPDGKGVEECVQKEIVKSLRQKIPVEQALDYYQVSRKRRLAIAAATKKKTSRKGGDYSIRAEVEPEIEPVERAERTDRFERTERPERTERTERPERTERTERPERTERTERPERTERTERPERTERTERYDRTERTGRTGRTDKFPVVEEVVETVEPEGKDSVFMEHIEKLSGTLSARLLDEGNKVIREVPVRDLATALRDANGNVTSVVFDGVITQRIVDIAANKGINTLIGAKIGNVVKSPSSMIIEASKNL
jgi:DNA primase